MANDVQIVDSTVTSSLGQIGARPSAASSRRPPRAVNGAISQLGTTVSSDISQITGQVTSDLKTFVSDVESGAQTEQADLSAAFNTASSILTPGFEQLGSQLETTFTSPAVKTGLSYSLDGLLILGGVAISASSVIDGPAGAMAGAMLLGAGVQGIEYNAENANSDGTVSGSWSWASYGENLGIGGATGFVSGGVGLAGEAVGGGILRGAATARRVGRTTSS